MQSYIIKPVLNELPRCGYIDRSHDWHNALNVHWNLGSKQMNYTN